MTIRFCLRITFFVFLVVVIAVVHAMVVSSHEALAGSTAAGNEARPYAKSIPPNAVKTAYTPEMIDCDKQLARVFAGPGAVAAANGFEPIGLSSHYPVYRGDLRGFDGRVHPGHLSYAMHIYGSADGTGITSLYVPTGFSGHSKTPTPTDAAITFYYPRLGNLTNVTVAVFHIANFSIARESDRVRIGEIGGRGGSYPYYRHSHIEFYAGNVGLPPANRRAALRIDPSRIFHSR